MNKNIPRYIDTTENIIYEADSCIPLREAVMRNEIELTALARGTYPGRMLKKEELTGIKSIGYWNIKKQQDWGLEWHTNEGLEICFLESGNLDFCTKNKTTSLHTDNLTITRPWIVHKLGNPLVDLSKLHWVILDVNVRHPHQQWEWPDWILLNQRDLEKLTQFLRQNEQPVWEANTEFRNCFVQIGKIIKQNTPNSYDSKLKIYINHLLMVLLEIFQDGKIQLDKSLMETKRSVMLFLETLESKIDHDWTVAEMAESCLLGVTRFTHYCQEISNCSPMEYLNKLRLRKATVLLIEQPGAAIMDIAFNCGFSSNQYFNYAFKKHFKKTPNEYRRDFN